MVRCGAVRCDAATDDHRTVAQQRVQISPGLRNRRVSTADVCDSPGVEGKSAGPAQCILRGVPPWLLPLRGSARSAPFIVEPGGPRPAAAPPGRSAFGAAQVGSHCIRAQSDSRASGLTFGELVHDPLPRHSDGADPVRKPAVCEFLAPSVSLPLREAPCADHLAPGL
jgi:hypothetical protein